MAGLVLAIAVAFRRRGHCSISLKYRKSRGGLDATQEAVRQWCRANNRQLADPNWEIYGHWQSEWNTNPSQIRTDVYYLLTS
jgi:hypothetical protein